MIENPMIICEVKGCFESIEYNENEMRPYIYHPGKDGLVHCAGKNPNYWKPTRRQYHSKTATATATPKDHMLKEYYGYGYKTKRVEDEEEIQEEDR